MWRIQKMITWNKFIIINKYVNHFKNLHFLVNRCRACLWTFHILHMWDKYETWKILPTSTRRVLKGGTLQFLVMIYTNISINRDQYHKQCSLPNKTFTWHIFTFFVVCLHYNFLLQNWYQILISRSDYIFKFCKFIIKQEFQSNICYLLLIN